MNVYDNQLRYGMAWRLSAVLWFVCLAGCLAGCGQGIGDNTAGVGTGGTGGSTGITRYALAAKAADSLNSYTLSGTVADGSLVNATVFLDKNNNQQLDEGEPSALTGFDGSYTLIVDPADVGAYPLLALVGKGVTIDKATNQPVLAGSLLSLAKDSVSAVGGNVINRVVGQLGE